LDVPFSRGLAWYRYKSLEDEFLAATRYFPFEKAHKKIWSEFFGDFLTKVGNSIDSFFRNMLKDAPTCSCEYKHVPALLASNRPRDICFFRDLFEPMYALSGAKVSIAYGLTFYDKNFRPFQKFGKQEIPLWWTAYNHVKHTWFDHVDEATLENVVGALAGLFILNVLNTSSRLYLIKHQNVIKWDYMKASDNLIVEDLMKKSKMGIPKNWDGYNFTASTPVFVHSYRSDKKAVY
jgi:hypothetical protein